MHTRITFIKLKQQTKNKEEVEKGIMDWFKTILLRINEMFNNL